jgi:transposase
VPEDEVDVINNLAERTIRTHVIWNKTSFGTQSKSGTLYMERVLTAVGSCKLQGKNILDYISQAVLSDYNGEQYPSLIPSTYFFEKSEAA